MVRHRSPNGFVLPDGPQQDGGQTIQGQDSGNSIDPFITKYSREWINVNEVEMSSKRLHWQG